MRTTSAFDRLLINFLACALFLTVLYLWSAFAAASCFALAFPTLALTPVFYGLLAYRLEWKWFAIDYYLDPASPLRRRLQRRWVSLGLSLAAGVFLTALLVLFTARARWTDWLFLVAAAVAAPLAFQVLSIWPGRHLRQRSADGAGHASAAELLTARLAGTALFSVLVVTYVGVSYTLVPVPGEYIFPDSLERTLEAFGARTGSACPVVNDTLLLAAQIEGLAWHLVTVTTLAASAWLHDGLRLIVWAGFFLNAAMVFAGFVRGLEGAILIACRTAAWRRKEPA